MLRIRATTHPSTLRRRQICRGSPTGLVLLEHIRVDQSICWLSSDTHPCTYQVSLHHPSQPVSRHQPCQTAWSFVRFQQSDNLSGYLLRRGIRRESERCWAIVAGCVCHCFSPVCSECQRCCSCWIHEDSCPQQSCRYYRDWTWLWFCHL